MTKSSAKHRLRIGALVIASAAVGFILLAGAIEFHIQNNGLVTVFEDRGHMNFGPQVELADPAKLLPTQVKVKLPEPKFESRRFDFPVPAAARYPENYFIEDPYLGIMVRPGLTARVIQADYGRNVTYDVEYRIDGYGRRRTFGEVDVDRRKPFLVLGCSFVFGEGVGQNETLPSQLAENHGDFKIRNYGMHGWGPGNILRLVRHADFANDLPRLPGALAIYVFMDHHMNRALGTFDIYQRGHLWEEHLPYYRLDRDGKLEDRGMMNAGRPVRNFLYSIFARLRLIQYFDLARFSSYSKREVATVAAMLDAIRVGVQNQSGAEFYVVFYPGSKASRALIPALDKLGVKTIDYSNVDLSRYTKDSPKLPDGNPSAQANEFLAKQILRDLELAGE